MPDLALLVLTLLWGTTFPLVKVALESSSASVFLLLRFGVAALAVGAVAWLGRARATPGVWRHGALLGIALGIGFALQTEGLRHTTPARSAFLTGLYVPLVPVLARVLLRRAVPSAAWAGMALATVGMALLTRPFDGSLAGPIRLGDGLTALAALAFGLHVLYLSEWSARHPLSLLTLGQIGVVLVMAALWAPLDTVRLEPTARFWGVILFTGLVMTGAAFWVMAWAQSRVSAVRAGLIYALEPVAAAIFSAWWLGERLAPSDWAGGAFIVAGVVLGEAAPALRRTRTVAEIDTLGPRT